MGRFAPLFLALGLAVIPLLEGCTDVLFFPIEELDVDGDGYTPSLGDCDDRDPAVHPGHPEQCDGLDNDCDGAIDGDDPELGDADGDGADACVDCDDGDPARSPDFEEACDGVDSDCDGEVPLSEVDGDGDSSLPCEGDCDDSNPGAAPGLPELCDGIDNDCDVLVDEQDDLDGDGFTACAGDCGPELASVHPGAAEVCDGLDSDCDGDLPSTEADADGDGQRGCEGDCDDTVASVFEGAPEQCNGQDDDCDLVVPSEEVDGDGDGDFGCAGDCDDADPGVGAGFPELCDGRDNDCDGVTPLDELDVDGDGQSPCAGDCNDQNPAVATGFPELCDALDNDCSGSVPTDELDSDGDGIAPCGGDCDDGSSSIFPGAPEVCDGADSDCSLGLPADEEDGDSDGVLPCDGDCDDGDPLSFSGAPELCDGLDNDCNGLVPDDELDSDGDGESVCAGDCDDDDPLRSSAFAEECSGIDDDCDGMVDDADSDLVDGDGDGFGPCSDCDDLSPLASPGLPENCGDTVDNDCDGFVDEPSPAGLLPRIAAGSGAGGRLQLWALDSSGQLLPQGLIGAQPQAESSIAALGLDLNGDGVAELVQEELDGTSAGLDSVHVIEEGCSASNLVSSLSSVVLPGDHRLMASGDFDGDGQQDLLSVRFDSVDPGDVRVHLGSSSGFLGIPDAAQLIEPTIDDRWTIDRQPVDHDGDGRVDLVACGWSPPLGMSTCRLYVGQGDGTFASGLVILLSLEPIDALASGDFNGDGAVDLLAGGSDHGDPGALRLLLGDGQGGFSVGPVALDLDSSSEAATQPGPGRAVLLVHDFDADGVLDLVASVDEGVASADRQLQVWQGDGSGGFALSASESYTSSIPDPDGPDWIALASP